jgi:hypothetical protein
MRCRRHKMALPVEGLRNRIALLFEYGLGYEQVADRAADHARREWKRSAQAMTLKLAETETDQHIKQIPAQHDVEHLL